MSEFLHHYVEIVSDPAHVAAEVTFMVVIDVVILGLLLPLVRKALLRSVDRRIHAEHHAIDAEHGINLSDPNIHAAHLASSPSARRLGCDTDADPGR